MRFLFFLVMIGFLMPGCNDTEMRLGKNVAPEDVYYDYQVWGEEGRDDVTVRIQYHFNGPDGPTLQVEEPARVMLDDTLLKVDSAKLTGAFYEAQKSAASFAGHHQILFVDKNRKKHLQDFDYTPFTIATEFPEKIKAEPLTIKFTGLPDTETLMRLVMTDTAFATKDVNEVVRIKNSELKIDSSFWRLLSSGPILFEVYHEQELPMQNGSKKGGRLVITYSLKRQFELVE